MHVILHSLCLGKALPLRTINVPQRYKNVGYRSAVSNQQLPTTPCSVQSGRFNRAALFSDQAIGFGTPVALKIEGRGFI